MKVNDRINELKKYCKDYIIKNYGIKNNYIRAMKASKNGLFIYGHDVYAPGYNLTYKIHTYISWYEDNNYNFINGLLDTFVEDCNRLKECN